MKGCSASFYFYRVAIARADKSFLNNNPDLAVTTSVDNPFSGNENWWGEQTVAEWSITSNDGLKLYAYYLAADRSTDRTVILAHGYAGQAQSKIVLHGVSMGGATVMMTSGEALPPNVKAIVEDCGYTTAKDQLAYQLKRMYRLPIFPLLHITSLLTKLRAGYFFGEASALDQLQKSKTPMLFIHGDADLFVPTEMVYELFKNYPSENNY